MFALFTSFCMFSSHLEILLKRDGIWVFGGAPVALRSDTAHPLPHGFSFFPPKNQTATKHADTHFFKILIDIGMMWVYSTQLQS